MKNGHVILVGALAVGITAVSVYALTRPHGVTVNNPAPGTIPTGGPKGDGWLGLANGLVNLGGNIVGTFGKYGSPKPTSPGESATGAGQNFAPLEPSPRMT